MDMNLVLGLTAGTSIGAGLLLGFLMRPSLAAALRDVCQKESGARFWSTFCQAVLVLFPLFIVSMLVPSSFSEPHTYLRLLVAGISGALLVTVLAIGRGIVEPSWSLPGKKATTEDRVVQDDLGGEANRA